MAGSFGASSTTDEVLEGVDLSGKRILVTGVSAGLGVGTARAQAAHGRQQMMERIGRANPGREMPALRYVASADEVGGWRANASERER